MMRRTDQRAASARLMPEGTFVIQLRSNSKAGQGRLSGRVEHVMTGQSVQFTSLNKLLAFMARYAPGDSSAAQKDKEEAS